ncbi:type VII secretion integral membrane protein EccD [Mycobacterium saskatchewanense]|uniref:Type VII secretion integral membrane protein EccD n=1 Tax=Mycobacterium saskatchewanense TaxID=220927 RepID=A0AAJ3TWM7_9MYCO|nr:type VII secretion integral membrane protein EccD [Mycobacterium saskatchewanense]ORW74219.1 type VII secretion integral membrane protein EccD [Mycobacterium saskatchewanense]BBX64155.1 type VII secretion integral membrane protein EccD [Mycobacterium saskatchewanense]
MSAPTASAAAAPAAAATTPAKPATTRVTILTGRRLTDVVLPSAAPIESYVDDAVAVLAEVLEGTPADVLAGFDFAAQGAWTFARPGAPPLHPDQSLDDAVVVDGSLLTLVPVSRTERYRPLVEDVIDAIAVLDESPEFDRSALNRFIAVALPFVAAVVTALSVFTWWNTGRQPWWPSALGVSGLVMVVGSWAAKRFYRRADFAESLWVAAFPLVAAAAALAVPPPRGAAPLGAPQLAAGGAAVLFLMLLTRGGPRRRAEPASFTAVTAIAVTAGALGYGFGWQHWVPGGAIVFGLVTVTSAAKLTVAVARIALPPIPAPGETVEHEELLDAVAGQEVADEGIKTRTWQAIIASVPESAVRLTERSELAKQLLIGFVMSGALILASGVIAVVTRGHFFVHSLVVAGLVTAACGFRSRLYAERWCAWALLAAALAIPIGVTVRLCLWYPRSAWLFLAVLVAALLVALAVVGATVGLRRVSPVAKRMLELLDGTLVAAILPMLLWITGVYDTVRNIQF